MLSNNRAERTKKLRIAVRYLLSHKAMEKGYQTRLAEHFKVTRQRVHQIAKEERIALLEKRAS
jgi:hypothetical protein